MLLVLVGVTLLAILHRLIRSENVVDPRRQIRAFGLVLVGIGGIFTGYLLIAIAMSDEPVDDVVFLVVLLMALFTAPGVTLVLAARLLRLFSPFGLPVPLSSVDGPTTRSRRCELRSADGTVLSFTEVAVIAADGRLDHTYRTHGTFAGQPITDAQLAQLIR